MSTKYTCRRITSVREQPVSNGIPLALVYSWQTPTFLLVPSSLASNRLFHDMSVTLITLVSRYEYEASTTFETDPLIGFHPFKDCHLNPQPDLPLAPNSVSNCLSWAPYENHFFPPIDITVLTPISPWYDLMNFCEVLPVFFFTTTF